MHKQNLKQLVCQEIDKLEPILYKLADYLHQHPEISMQEIKAVNYLKKLLEKFQFIFTPILEDTFSTAFIATKGNGNKKIGFLAEYDALLDIGHGCGHNLISLMSIGAGLAFNTVTDKMAKTVIFGCPAEETIGAKLNIADAGYFNEFTSMFNYSP